MHTPDIHTLLEVIMLRYHKLLEVIPYQGKNI